MTILTLSTHNVNGFHHSEDYIKSKCKVNENLVYAMQETWLKPAYKKHLGVDKLRHVNDNFEGYGVSAMTSDISIYKGRPFGGTGFLFPKKFTVSMKPCPIYKNDRVSVLKVQSDSRVILLFNVYFPYFNSGTGSIVP